MKKKHLMTFLSLVLVAVVSIGVTFAYLTDEESNTNTFTVGKVGIELDEAEVNLDGTIKSDKRVKENTYHLLPGHTYIKDPTVTVDEKSEDAYVRMLVTVENIDKLTNALSDAKYYDNGIFLLQMLCVDENGNNTWDSTTWNYAGCTTNGNNCTYEFRYKEIVAKSDTATKLSALFSKITVPGEIDNDGIAGLNTVKIVATAHAIQADGFATADAAWSNFPTDTN